MSDKRSPADAALSRRVAHGFLTTFSGRGAAVILRLLAMLVLVRFVSPTSYGLFGILSSIHILLVPIAMLGLNLAAVQRETLTIDKARDLFWVSSFAGLLLTVLVFFGAPLLRLAFDDSRLSPLFQGLGSTYILVGVSTIPLAILHRDLRFRRIAAIDLVATATSLIFAIVLGTHGAQAWSLVGMTICHQFLMTAGALQATRFSPGWPRIVDSLRRELTFGFHVAANTLIFQASRRLDNILLGLTGNLAGLGQYTRAYSLFLTPISNLNQSLSSVAIPALSRNKPEDKAFERLFTGLLSAYCWATPGVSLLFLVNSREIVEIALGHTWHPVAEILRYLTIGSFFIPFMEASRWALIASGRSALLLRWGIITATCDAIGVIVGVRFGPNGVALGLSAAAAVNALTGIFATSRGGVVSMKTYVRAFLAPYLTLLAAGTLGWTMRTQLQDQSHAVILLTTSGVVLSVSALGVWQTGALNQFLLLFSKAKAG